MLAEGGQIALFIVRRSGLPAFKNDPDPFKGQRSDGRLIAAPVSSLLAVKSFRPGTDENTLRRILHHGLTQKRRTLPAPVHLFFLTAALSHRGNAKVFLYVIRGTEAPSLLSKASIRRGARCLPAPGNDSNTG